jgi:hypothetical protein
MGRPNFKRLGRRFNNTVKRVGTIVKRGANMVRSLIGNVDKMSGGQITRAITSDPRAMALMSGLNQITA